MSSSCSANATRVDTRLLCQVELSMSGNVGERALVQLHTLDISREGMYKLHHYLIILDKNLSHLWFVRSRIVMSEQNTYINIACFSFTILTSSSKYCLLRNIQYQLTIHKSEIDLLKFNSHNTCCLVVSYQRRLRYSPTFLTLNGRKSCVLLAQA